MFLMYFMRYELGHRIMVFILPLTCNFCCYLEHLVLKLSVYTKLVKTRPDKF